MFDMPYKVIAPVYQSLGSKMRLLHIQILSHVVALNATGFMAF